jgi:hypothetical protein
VVQLYPQALGSLFVAFYYSQGYGGDVLTPAVMVNNEYTYLCEDL